MTHLWEEISNVMTTVISPTPWKASEALRLMDLEQVTVGQGVPSQWRLMLDHSNFPSTDLSHLRIAGTGAAPVPPDLVWEMRDRLGCPVVIGYASTEAAIISGSDPDDSADVIARTVGRPRSNVEVQIVGESGSLPSGEVGTVRCRSAAVMRRYWRNPEATAEAIDGDGWLSTGDLGSLDSEGYLVLAGRKTDMYFRGAYNIYPMEVERILFEHSAVYQVAVVAKSDPVLGDVGVAFVVPAPGEQPTLEELRGWCKRSLADYKAPDILALVPELPLTPIGKVDKATLSEVASSLERKR
jgi:acyl-CoA synthetase (AMP-forming)/AMP-acid ligase II